MVFFYYTLCNEFSYQHYNIKDMKKIFLILSLTMCYCLVWANKPVHVIITAGQSNTDGRVPNNRLPEYIKALAKDTVEFAEGAYKHCKISQNRPDGRFFPYWPKSKKRSIPNAWTYDAITYYLLEQSLQEDFYVIKWAVGGTSIAPLNVSPNATYWSADPEWLSQNMATCEKDKETNVKGKSLLLSFTKEIDACIDRTLSKIENGYQIDAFLWHQGEGDNSRGSEYYDNIKAVLAYVRNHLSEKTSKDYSKLPFILGTVPHKSKQYDAEVEAAMKRLAAEDPNVYLIDMSNGELLGDKLHFNQVSAEYMGKQVYDLLVKILKL